MVENPNPQPNKTPQEKTDALAEGKKRKRRHPDYLRKWRAKNPDREKNYSQKGLARRTAWAKSNPEKRRVISRRYYFKNRPVPKPPRQLVQSPLEIHRRHKRRTNIQFMLMDRFRATSNRAFRRQWIKKPARTEALLGCTIADAKAHIESQFTSEMSWLNRGSFVIDHHVPIAAFDLRNTDEVALAFNWRNLKPLTQHENSIKSDTLPYTLPTWLPPEIASRITNRQLA